MIKVFILKTFSDTYEEYENYGSELNIKDTTKQKVDTRTTDPVIKATDDPKHINGFVLFFMVFIASTFQCIQNRDVKM